MGDLRRRWWLVLVGLIILVVLFGTRLATFYTDVLWFESIGYEAVFWTLLTTQLGLGVVAGVAMFGLLAGNLLLARRLAPRYRMPTSREEGIERYRQAIEPFARPLVLAVALVTGILSGISVAPEWPRYVLWSNAVEFGQADPQFGRDLGYFTFVLPFHTLLNSWLFTALVLTLALTAVAHYLFGGIRPQSPGQKITPEVNVHLSVLLAALVAVRAWGFWLDRYMLSYSERGQVTGLSYTDVNAQLVAYQLLAVLSAACVVLFLVNVRFRGWLLPLAGVGILVVAAVVLAGIYPAVIQRFRVDPEELARERPYIQRNLELTRFGFGLDDVSYNAFPAESELSAEEVEANSTTLESIRLWDPATLQSTYQQLQELRPYYDFRDVDVDRYDVNGELSQAMISVRELNSADIPGQAQTWQNQAMVYTHGYGLVASAVSSKNRDGQPVFLVENIPPEGVDRLEVENPRVYFGENPPAYSIVQTRERELDFPTPEGDPATHVYDGEDGVGVGSPLRRLAFALRYSEPNILLSSLITDESKILYNRDIREERLEQVAPYLQFDHDAYPVAVDGRIKWVVDGYTISDMLPYSERVDLAGRTLAEQRRLQAEPGENGITFREVSVPTPGLVGQANYIRNSVKAVVDAYDGTVTLYVIRPDDPIIQAWMNVFPDSFTSVEDASDELIEHFRYPEDMFRVQSSLFETYHIQDADQFYTKEDAWDIPNDAAFFANQAPIRPEQRTQRPMRPYYLLMRLPGQEREEFALIQPFTPAERNVMTAWLAGRSDPENYGELRAYVMPPTRTVFGPEQIQARIDQDDAVSEQITLWNQSGSSVIYGNLLVIPVEDSLLYAQPLFLRGEQSEIPVLQRTILVFGDAIVMEETLEEALAAVFGDAAPSVRLPPGADDDEVAAPGIPETPSEPGAPEADPRVADLLEDAIRAFADAEAALRDGDLGRYQELTGEAERLLQEAQALIEGEVATPPATEGAGSAGAGAEENAPAEPAATEEAALAPATR